MSITHSTHSFSLCNLCFTMETGGQKCQCAHLSSVGGWECWYQVMSTPGVLPGSMRSTFHLPIKFSLSTANTDFLRSFYLGILSFLPVLPSESFPNDKVKQSNGESARRDVLISALQPGIWVTLNTLLGFSKHSFLIWWIWLNKNLYLLGTSKYL